MEIGESIKKVIQELILPELNIIKGEYKEIKLLLGAVNTRLDDMNIQFNKRLDDMNIHIVDQSRRIDETNKRIDVVRKELTERIDVVREKLTERIDEVREELSQKIYETNERIDGLRDEIGETNNRINRLYEVIVRREEHERLEIRMMRLEKEVDKKRKIAA